MSCGGKCNKDGCHGGNLEPLCESLRDQLLEELGDWQLLEKHLCPLCGDYSCPVEKSLLFNRITKEYSFENFVDALEFVNKIGLITEEMNHHPNIRLEWGKVRVEIWTHAVNDLTMADFILAREIDYIE
jgi:4a-hydroxytetrahydrobiopterin dehydratase